MEGSVVDMESQAFVWNHILGVVNSLVLKLAVKLQIADTIARRGRPVTVPELAASIPVACTNLPILRRILRYLAHMRLITVHPGTDGHGDDDSNVAYGLSPASTLIANEGSNSLAAFITFFLDEDFLTALHALDTCLTGDPATPAYERVKGESIWARASRVPAHKEALNEGMAVIARLAVAGVASVCRATLEGTASLVDVGGGTGTAARAIVKEFPQVRCTVLDLPHVVAGLPEFPGVTFVGGDMFDSVPPAEAILLMWILHDWDDERCGRILKRCREALPKDGKLIVVDAVISEGEKNRDDLSDARLAFDMVMMAYTGGKERTEGEWRVLLSGAGFRRCKITPITALQHVIEAQGMFGSEV